LAAPRRSLGRSFRQSLRLQPLCDVPWTSPRSVAWTVPRTVGRALGVAYARSLASNPAWGPERGLEKGLASDRAEALQVATKEALQGPVRRALQRALASDRAEACKWPRKRPCRGPSGGRALERGRPRGLVSGRAEAGQEAAKEADAGARTVEDPVANRGGVFGFAIRAKPNASWVCQTKRLLGLVPRPDPLQDGFAKTL